VKESGRQNEGQPGDVAMEIWKSSAGMRLLEMEI